MKIHLKIFIAFFLIITILADAQENSGIDTVKINEIIIRANPGENITDSWKRIIIDSGLLSGKKILNLSDIMAESLPLFIKTYGPGSLSTISFRGTGAVHTQVSWNGIILNSPMLGQTDLSIIPAAFADEISVECGGSSMYRTNGAFGGLINLNTKPEWKKGLRINFDGGTGSFGLWSASLKAESGNNKYQSVTRIFYRRADNNYRYLNAVSFSEPVYERRKNAGYHQQAIMHELYFKGNNSVSSVSVWAQAADRNLPPNILMIGTETGESQKDAAVRAIFSHSKYYNKSSYDFTSAVIFDRLHYVNKMASINSLNQSVSFISKGAFETKLNSGITLKITLNDKLNIVESVNYDGLRKQNIFSVTGIARKNVFNSGGITLLASEIINGKEILLPDFSAGFDYYFTGKTSKWIKVNLSRNSRIPSMNDMYWNPGGNPGIRNEYSFAGEIDGGIIHKFNSDFAISGETSFYLQGIRDMIQWLPGDNNYWSPENILSVNITGFETDFSIIYNKLNFKFLIHGHYTCNKSVYKSGTEETDNKQLIYVPLHQAGGKLKLEYNRIYLTINGEYTGKRFTEVDNSKYLPGYIIVNSEAGINYPHGQNNLGLKVRVENIFNTEYEVIAYYPMPGRWFMVSLNYRFIK